MPTAYFTFFQSPVGPLQLLSDGARLTGLFMNQHAHFAPSEAWVEDNAIPPFADARRQLEEYFAGRLREFDLPLSPAGTPFQMRVWEELRRIPYGQTISYGELARRIGSAAASRAVGLANGRNPISIIIPCHRVIGASGKLTGYGGGMERKQFLLALESQAAAPTLAL